MQTSYKIIRIDFSAMNIIMNIEFINKLFCKRKKISNYYNFVEVFFLKIYTTWIFKMTKRYPIMHKKKKTLTLFYDYYKDLIKYMIKATKVLIIITTFKYKQSMFCLN